MKRIFLIAFAALFLLSGCKKDDEIYVMTDAEALDSVVAIWTGDENGDVFQFNRDLSGSWMHEDGIEILTYTVTPEQDGTALVEYKYEEGQGKLVLPEVGSLTMTTLNGFIYRKSSIK